MKTKTVIFTLAMALFATWSFAASPVSAPVSDLSGKVSVVSPEGLHSLTILSWNETAEAACTVNATFETNGQTVEVTVTADDCATAVSTLAKIAKALDAE